MLGWNVVRVPHWKWESVSTRKKETTAYLNNIFAEVDRKKGGGLGGVGKKYNAGSKGGASSSSRNYGKDEDESDFSCSDSDEDHEEDRNLFRPTSVKYIKEEDVHAVDALPSTSSRRGTKEEKKLYRPPQVRVDIENVHEINLKPVKHGAELVYLD